MKISKINLPSRKSYKQYDCLQKLRDREFHFFLKKSHIVNEISISLIIYAHLEWLRNEFDLNLFVNCANKML